MIIGDIRHHVARKKHSCVFCGGTIEPGERYQAWVWRESRDEICFSKNHPFCKIFYENHCVDRGDRYSYEIHIDAFWGAIAEWRRDVEVDLGLPTHFLDSSYVPGKPCFGFCCNNHDGTPIRSP